MPLDLPTGQLLSATDARAVLPAVLAAVDDSPAHGSAFLQWGFRVRPCSFVVDPEHEYWEQKIEPDLQHTHENGRRHDSHNGAYDTAFAADVPAPLHLLFPESLPVWGRPSDDFRPDLVEQHGDRTVITLIHLTDPGRRGTVVYDDQLRALTLLGETTGMSKIDTLIRGPRE